MSLSLNALHAFLDPRAVDDSLVLRAMGFVEELVGLTAEGERFPIFTIIGEEHVFPADRRAKILTGLGMAIRRPVRDICLVKLAEYYGDEERFKFLFSDLGASLGYYSHPGDEIRKNLSDPFYMGLLEERFGNGFVGEWSHYLLEVKLAIDAAVRDVLDHPRGVVEMKPFFGDVQDFDSMVARSMVNTLVYYLVATLVGDEMLMAAFEDLLRLEMDGFMPIALSKSHTTTYYLLVA